MKKNNIYPLLWILIAISCTNKNVQHDNVSNLKSISGDCNLPNLGIAKSNSNLFEQALCINEIDDDEIDNTFYFAKISSNFIDTDSVKYQLFYLKGKDGRSLTGYWGLLKETGIGYFIPLGQENCSYPIFSIYQKKITYEMNSKPKACLINNTSDLFISYESETSIRDSLYYVQLMVLPVEGVNITYEKHLKYASRAVFTISICRGILNFEYDPDIQYTILPWAMEYVGMNKP
ncbi:hypothetical protein [Fulvivirga sediminis]|uniref:Lipoprotein n=1 Tax=Fulvivirga sediminis TaxID=2803949 RepID=A0A937K195_9BACT|nr:hypothetical protein [Fulvivirga sediminis]MBL3657115.1 hypothetical protein [Fulvivirga sediminis]